MAIKLMPVALPTPHVDPAHEHPEARVPRKRRRAAVFDADGREVLISLMCLKCHTLRPLSMFGLRKMADGAIRNQPWCRVCRGASSPKKAAATEEANPVPVATAPPSEVAAAPMPAAPMPAAPAPVPAPDVAPVPTAVEKPQP